MRDTTLNFGGFYDSIHSAILDRFELEDEGFKKACETYSKNYVTIVNEALETNFKFLRLDSPKFYNYETDTIQITYSLSDVKTLLEMVDRDEFEEYVNEKTKSYDGFISFYDGFKDVKKDLDVLMSFLLDYIFENVEDPSEYVDSLYDCIEI